MDTDRQRSELAADDDVQLGLLCLLGGASSITAFVIGFVPPSQLGHQSPLLYALLILAGILAIGIVPPLLMDRFRRPGWKAGAASQPAQATGSSP